MGAPGEIYGFTPPPRNQSITFIKAYKNTNFMESTPKSEQPELFSWLYSGFSTTNFNAKVEFISILSESPEIGDATAAVVQRNNSNHSFVETQVDLDSDIMEDFKPRDVAS